MLSTLRLLPVALVAAGSLSAAEFIGRLDPVAQVGTRSGGRLAPAPAELITQIPAALPDGARVWAMSRNQIEIKGRTLLFAVVEPTPGSFTAWIDRDFDGRWSADENWALPAGGEMLKLGLAWNNGIFAEFPFELQISRRGDDPAAPPGYLYNFNILFTATVDLDGRPLRIAFYPRISDSAINPTNVRITMDTNFNGRIESNLGESENPTGTPPVFRVDRRYVAVRSADVETGAVVLEERPVSDYTRFDALPGQEMPDFTFATFDRTTHKLSDFRGRYVLLDFWGTWCGPCIGEMRHLDPIYEKYHPRGFEVIGLNMEKSSGNQKPEVYARDEEKVKTFLAKAGHKWIQATQRSIERFALDVIHVNSYPTCILIGPDGKVISREARGEILERLLAEAFPDAS